MVKLIINIDSEMFSDITLYQVNTVDNKKWVMLFKTVEDATNILIEGLNMFDDDSEILVYHEGYLYKIENLLYNASILGYDPTEYVGLIVNDVSIEDKLVYDFSMCSCIGRTIVISKSITADKTVFVHAAIINHDKDNMVVFLKQIDIHTKYVSMTAKFNFIRED